jgi:para-aminobenzoate synthetase/4-amino-4-deoxychorismate lyase
MVTLPLPDSSRGVFETLLVAAGAPVELEAHLARLRTSLGALYGAPLPTDAEPLVAGAAAELELGRLRLSATPSGAGSVELEVVTAAIDAAIVCPPWEHGLELRSCPVANWNGGHKWADRRLLESLEAATAPATPLLTGADGALLETTRANLFVVDRDGVLVTPPADGRILPGVARMRAIEAARAAGIDVVERTVAHADLAGAREAFGSGSIRCVEPVRSFDGEPVGSSRPWLTTAIAATLSERWLGDRGPATPA